MRNTMATSERVREAVQRLAEKQRNLQDLQREYVGLRHDAERGYNSEATLEQEWRKVEDAAAEVEDARRQYTEALAEEEVDASGT
jgi:chromosome segregation ATPase